MKKCLLIATLACLAVFNAKALDPNLGIVIGTLDGPDGTVHMKKGYDYYWHKVLEYDEYGRVYVKDEMVVTYKGRRVTD